MKRREATWARLPADRFTMGLTVGTQPPIRRVETMLRLARLGGYDVAWTVDHFQGFYPTALWDRDLSWVADPAGTPHAYFDYQTLLGRLSVRAGSLHLAVGVTEPIRRHPLLIAQAFLTLSHLTRRAPILGIGAGERENVDPYGLSFERPVGRLEDALAVIRKAFHSRGPLAHQGSFYRFDDALMDLGPAAGRMPEIWIAAHGPRMLRLTGEYGDGWYPTLPMTPGEYDEKLRTIRCVAAASGRDPAAITAGWQAFVVIGRSERQARAMLGSRAIRFSALLTDAATWSRVGASHPLGDGHRGMVDFVPERYTRAELDAAIAAVPVEALAEVALWGTPRQLKLRLGDYRDAGLRHLVIQPASALVSKRDAVYSLAAMVRIGRYLKRRSR
jgi:phthiodiolone/phenolphthiodiolone dimycocerosates ketoreductase